MNGSIREIRPGVWQIDFDLGPDPVTGRRRRRSRRVHGTLQDAERVRARVVADVLAGEWADPSTVTVAEFGERWLGLVRVSVAETTWVGYRSKLRGVMELVGSQPVSRLSGESLQRLYGRMLEVRSAQSVVHAHRVLHRMLADAVRWGLLARNPAADATPPRIRRGRLSTWSAPQVRQFLQLVAGDDLEALWRLAVTTGMRRGELCGLRWPNVHLDTGMLDVVESRVMYGGKPGEGATKTRAGRRRVALDGRTVQLLDDHRARQEQHRQFFADVYQTGDWVWAWEDGRPRSPDWISKRYRQIIRASDLPPIRLHDLRHTWATLALQAGVPAKVVADRLGHAGIQITLDLYTHHVPELDRKAADQVAGLFDQQEKAP